MAPTDPETPAHRVTGLAAGSRAAHGVRPANGSLRLTAAVVGAVAALAAVGFGTAALLRSPGPTASTLTTARHITVTTPVIPLSGPQIVALAGHPPDYGPLGDPVRRASCLAGLGYRATTAVLGARPVTVEGRTGVLLVLAGDTGATLVAVAVSPGCSAADTGLLAQTTVART